MADASGIAGDRLKSFIERVERLSEEKQAIADDIKEVFAEAKSAGFEVKIMKAIIKLRAMDAQERAEQEQLIDVYAQAVGLAHTPLGDAAEKREAAAEMPSGRDETDPETVENAKIVLRGKPLNDDGRISGCVSYVQRNLGLGYNAAARIIEKLEVAGFIGAPNAAGSRVLIAPPEPDAAAPANPPPKSVTGSIAALKTAMHAPAR